MATVLCPTCFQYVELFRGPRTAPLAFLAAHKESGEPCPGSHQSIHNLYASGPILFVSADGNLVLPEPPGQPART